jgi:hypothetical protein
LHSINSFFIITVAIAILLILPTMPKTDYIPAHHGHRISWWTNLRSKLSSHATALNFSPTDVAEFDTWATEEIAEINAIEQCRAAYHAAVSRYRENSAARTPLVRRAIARGKTARDYTDAIGADLAWIGGSARRIDVDTYRPTIRASLSGSRILLKYRKNGVDGLNIYRRLRGTEQWTLIGFDSRSPFEDKPKEEGSYEYRAVAVKDEKQIGQPSYIVTITYLK